MAAVFNSYDVGEDDVIAVLLRNDVTYLEVIEACRYVGATYVTLNWHAAKSEIEHILQDSQANLLIGHSDLVRIFAETDVHQLSNNIPVLAISTPAEICRAYNVDPKTSDRQTDLQTLINKTSPINTPPLKFRGMFSYTSGSTGRPKGIKRIRAPDSPDPFEVYAGLGKSMLGLSPGDRFYVAAPIYHSAPNVLSLFCLACGDVDIFLKSKFDPEGFLADVQRYAITHCYIVPTMMIRLLKLPADIRRKYNTSTLRYAVSSGSAWPADVKAAMIDWFGPIFYESYGASEIGFMTLISSAEALQKPGSVGKVLPGGSIKILDDEHCEQAASEVGSIYIHLPIFGEFSYTNDEGNLQGQRHNEYSSVGDIGYLDADGYLYISDRKKDMIISGGANIFPAEIEAALIEMPQILDCAIFAAPHPEFGEMVVAAVSCSEGNILNLEQVCAFLDTKIARYKLPRKLDIHQTLPREDSGKIFKQRLREPYWRDVQSKI
ncbi:MAG: long-chain acyl-CoA synthetase [Paraglaciecola sp.]